MYSTSEGYGIVFLFITIHPNESKRGRKESDCLSRRCKLLLRGQDPYVAEEQPSPNKVPIPSDSLQFVRQNALEFLVSFKIHKYKQGWIQDFARVICTNLTREVPGHDPPRKLTIQLSQNAIFARPFLRALRAMQTPLRAPPVSSERHRSVEKKNHFCVSILRNSNLFWNLITYSSTKILKNCKIFNLKKFLRGPTDLVLICGPQNKYVTHR